MLPRPVVAVLLPLGMSLAAAPAAARSGVTLTLGGIGEPIAYGPPVSLPFSFERPGAPEGEVPELILEADPHPFGEWREQRRLTAQEIGHFRSVEVAPDRNTRYRLRYAGPGGPAVSEERQVDVNLNTGILYEFIGAGRARVTLFLGGPDDALRGVRMTMPLYLGRVRAGRLHGTRVRFVRLRRIAPGRARRTVVVRLPFRRRLGDTMTSCLREPRTPDAWGVKLPLQRHCGDGRVRFPRLKLP